MPFALSAFGLGPSQMPTSAWPAPWPPGQVLLESFSRAILRRYRSLREAGRIRTGTSFYEAARSVREGSRMAAASRGRIARAPGPRPAPFDGELDDVRTDVFGLTAGLIDLLHRRRRRSPAHYRHLHG